MKKILIIATLMIGMKSFAGVVGCTGETNDYAIGFLMEFDNASGLMGEQKFWLTKNNEKIDLAYNNAQSCYISPDRNFVAFNAYNEGLEPLLIVEFAGAGNTENRIEIMDMIVNPGGSNQLIKLKNASCIIQR